MVKIAIIIENNCEFPEFDNIITPLLYKSHLSSEKYKLKEKITDYIKKTIQPYVTIKEVSYELLIEQACYEITKDYKDHDITNDFLYDSEKSYIFPTKYFEMIDCKPNKTIERNINNIGCNFSLEHKIIKGNCFILKYEFDFNKPPKFLNLKSITMNDITKIIKHRYYVSAILITQNGFEKYYFQNLSYLLTKIYNLEEDDQITKMHINFMKYNLVMYTMQDCNDYINMTATRINGRSLMFGNVLIINELADGIYDNLTLREINKINKLSFGTLDNRELTEEENDIWSKHIIINNRFKKHKMKCYNCGDSLKEEYNCVRCYRIIYCSRLCYDSNKKHDCVFI